MRSEQVRSIIRLVLLVTVVSRLASSMYLPALPAMQQSLHLSMYALNNTLTVFFGCFAGATLVAGPIIDAYGRKVVVFWGLVFFIIGSLFAGMAQGVWSLLAGRALQAVGAGFIPASGRTMIRDACPDEDVVGVLGWLGAIGSLVPIMAPVLGGMIVEYMDWRSIFIMLALAGGVSLLMVWMRMPETNNNLMSFDFRTVFGGYFQMFCSRSFAVIMLPASCCFIIQGLYFATAPYLYVKVFHWSPGAFGVVNIGLVMALLLGRSSAARLLKRYSEFAVFVFHAAAPLLSGLVMTGLVLTHSEGAISFLAGAAIYAFGFGGILPLATKSVLTAFRKRGGMASALFGCCTIGAMSIGSALVSLFDIKQQFNVAAILAVMTLVFGFVTALSACFSRKHLA